MPHFPPQVLVSHSGKQHAYRHAAAVQRAGGLGAFVTSGYYRPDRWPDKLVRRIGAIDRRLRRRHFEGVDSRRVIRRWRFELPELLARAIKGNGSLSEKLMFRRDARFDEWVARKLPQRYDIFWGFQGSCLESLRAARAAGKIAVCEFATAHVTYAIELLQQEAEKHPEWADSISNLNFPDWYRERLEREPLVADVCIVASHFTRKSLESVGVEASKIRHLPLGVDLEQFTPQTRSPDGRFRILFVGGVGQRKGIKYLLEAYKKIRTENTELVLVGPVSGEGKALAEYAGIATILGRVDQGEVVRQMKLSHVLVLPSVFEGFGLVIPEAMATGMPVIASTHSIGPEMITDGVDGFVLEPDDVEGLAEKLQWLAAHRRESVEMGQAASRSCQSFSWESHADMVGDLLATICNAE